jgi:hypothetical protein
VPKQDKQEMFRDSGGLSNESGISRWLDNELAGCEFQDERLGNRFRKFVRKLAENIGESIPLACQDWANTKGAYRFLANEKVSEQMILAGHFQSTRERFSATHMVD